MGEYEDKVNEVEVEKELENFKSAVNRDLEGLKKSISDLKNSIIEIRASIGEKENPFQLLKAVASEEDLAEEGLSEKEESEGILETRTQGFSPSNFKTCFSLVKWVWNLIDIGLDEDDMRNLSNYCEFFGLIPKGASRYISDLSLAITKAKKLGLNEEILLLCMYSAAKASGLKFELEDITDMVFNAIRTRSYRPVG